MILGQIDEAISRLTEKRARAIVLLQKGGYNIPDTNEIVEVDKHLNFRLRPEKLNDLKIACVMDRFTLDSYAPECQMMEVTPSNWESEISQFKPDLLFIESAWEGKDKLWYKKIAGGSPEYFNMVSYCREVGIPVVFWNKEDPVYTDTFISAAQLADVVFTTDIDCIARYKSELGHDNVYHLHFAAQPKIHNPVEKYSRKDRFCFAGAYYHRYKERAKVFDDFSIVLESLRGLDIYDRNFGNARQEHAFPKRYESNILGHLDSSEIDKAYKGYLYGINMNSIQQSQTMFARRVFEMMASNTVTIGNYSRGVKNYFGELTICTDSSKTLESSLNKYCGEETALRKYRLAGLRKVLSFHLYEDRLDYIVQKVFRQSIKKEQPLVTVICRTASLEGAKKAQAMFECQSYKNKKLLLITNKKIMAGNQNVTVINEKVARQSSLSDFVREGFVAVFEDQDYYGKNYLLDLVLTTRYSDSSVIGKATYYHAGEINGNLETVYTSGQALARKRSIFCHNSVNEETLLDAVSGAEVTGFSIDEFNYSEGCDSDAVADDLYIEDMGIPLSVITEQAEKIKMPDQYISDSILIANDIYNMTPPIKNHRISVSKVGEILKFKSALNVEEHYYIYFTRSFKRDDLDIKDGKIKIQFIGNSDCEAICTVIFADINGKQIVPAFTKLNRREQVDVPSNAVAIKFAVRLKGPGLLSLKKIAIGENLADENAESCFLSRSNVLVLSNQYPTPENLYRNMFVHQRVLSYLEDGIVCDVMRMNIYAKNEFYEFEGVNVASGQASILSSILSSGKIDTVCVHFLDAAMWSVLKEYLPRIRILVWVHGSEIQPWWRREYNFTTEAELEKGKSVSDQTITFWKDVFKYVKNDNLHFIFVSQYFADEVMQDHKIDLPKEAYSIIHNVINTDLFNYNQKPQEQNAKILSIKPYASKKYANDVTTKAIVSISKHPAFNNLEFFICGDGERFEEDTAALKRFKNVHLIKKFFTQKEISEFHKKCGIYIATTRMDAQGVSRDEAMSSGLVPIANAVAAIPEFVDENCGILVPGEDYEAVGRGIILLYENPDLFLKLSEGAAKRVRSQTSHEFTISKEIEMIKRGTDNGEIV